jgi:5-methylcytosine-specific restriction endonuclease McrA
MTERFKVKQYARKTDVDENGRVCTRCLRYKTWDNYRKNTKAKTGHQETCKSCRKEGRGKRDIKQEKQQASKRREVLKKLDPFLVKARDLRSRLLSRFKTDQQAFKQTTPTTEEIYAWLTGHSLVCEYSGIKLDVSDITVDHRTPIARGGTNELENLAICSNHMNTAKGRMNEYEFRSLLKIIKHWEDGGQGILKRLNQGHFG